MLGVVWAIFAALHVLPLLYFSISAYAYWVLRDSGVNHFLDIYDIGMKYTHYRAVSLAYGFVALLHLWFLLQMICSSVQKRKFAFNDTLQIKHYSSSSYGIRRIRRVITSVYDTIFSSTGLLGVNGPCFELVLLLREVLETLLQTAQACRMSQFLSRPALNKLYIGLLVLNCWMMALVHSIFHGSETSRYFASLSCDLMLDIASSIGVPQALAMSYSKDTDMSSPSLFGLKWFEDIWLANASSEFQLILVVSWADLASKLIFAISMVGTMNTLKRFVGTALGRTNEVG